MIETDASIVEQRIQQSCIESQKTVLKMTAWVLEEKE